MSTRRFTIGITGVLGSGKSTVAGIMAKRGGVVVDMDAAGRWAVEQNETVKTSLRERFGDSFFNSDGDLLRKQLGELVFSSPEKLQQLNEIVHPVMLSRVCDLVTHAREHSNVHLVLLDAALLFELSANVFTDKVITVAAADDIRSGRLEQRDRLTREQIMQRTAAQLSQDEKIKRADYCIWNNEGFDSLQIKVDAAWQWIFNQ